MSREIVIARDSRVSGPMFHRVVLAALQSVGATVVDLDMAPTPTVQLAVEDRHAAGGLAITASHNPIEWNAQVHRLDGSSSIPPNPRPCAHSSIAASDA
jgi:phosphomannomutase